MSNLVGPFIGTILLITGVGKLRDLSGFAKKLDDYKVIPASFSRYVAPAVASLEIIIGAAALVPPTNRMALPAASGLLILFALSASVAIAKGTEADCGCGINPTERLRMPVVLRAVSMAAASLAAVFWEGPVPAQQAFIIGVGLALIYLSVSSLRPILADEFVLPSRKVA